MVCKFRTFLGKLHSFRMFTAIKIQWCHLRMATARNRCPSWSLRFGIPGTDAYWVIFLKAYGTTELTTISSIFVQYEPSNIDY